MSWPEIFQKQRVAEQRLREERRARLLIMVDLSCESCEWKGEAEIDQDLVWRLQKHDAEYGTSLKSGYFSIADQIIISQHNQESSGCRDPKISGKTRPK